eukprot:jgi/Botrbrau1/23188/Bobra.0041s0036.1
MSLSQGSQPSELLSLPNLPSNNEGTERADPTPVSPDADGQSLGHGSFGGTAGLGTPFHSNLRYRADLGASALRSHRRRSLSSVAEVLESDGLASSDGADPEALHTFVWGTTLNLVSITSRLRRFLTRYEDPQTSDLKYMVLLRQMYEHNETCLNVDCMNIYAFDPQLYNSLVMYPSEVLVLLDKEAASIVAEMAGEENADFTIETKPYNLRETKVIRDLNPTDIQKLISVEGMLTRCSSIIPDLRIALYKCESCGAEEFVMNERGRVEEPTKCTQCAKPWTQRLIHNRSSFYDKQILKMQENPNAIPEGETPHNVTMLVYEALVDTAKPGDRITITGIYRAQPLRVNPRNRALKAVYKSHIDVLHIQKEESSNLFSVSRSEDDVSQADPTQSEEPSSWIGDVSAEQRHQQEQELQALAQDPEIYEKLASSIAPSIWQLDDVKKGILCQLFGGTCKEFSGGRVRGEINVLLVGDPGVSKSQLLGYVHQLAPRGIYTSGRGSSAVGLTAYVTKDPETKEMVLESGALVLSDKGICCIDEFDKMSEAARSMLHEVMEQQTVSVAKAGIIASLNARTSVLASANPVGSRYNPRLSIIDNIHLPPSLISRFDLIYLVLDKPDAVTDRKLARHLISLYYERRPPSSQALIPMEKLRTYIAYARARCNPILSDDAAQELIEGYLNLRRMGSSRKVITATPRQLESLVRLSEALARMRLSDSVTSADVTEAIRLMKVAMQQSATDPVTGAIDMDMIQTGVSASARIALQQIAQEIQALLIRTPAGLTIDQLVAQVNSQSSLPVDAQQIKDSLRNIADQITVTGSLIKHKNVT